MNANNKAVIGILIGILTAIFVFMFFWSFTEPNSIINTIDPQPNISGDTK